MLKELHITNIILVESAKITFQDGLNVITGETGAGKSAVMQALSLIAGSRSDAGVIRKDAEKGSIEAIFSIDAIPNLIQILENAGIEHNPEEDMIVRREISSVGKSRAFINNQMVQLSLLRTVGDLLMDLIGQHANQNLRTVDHHRKLVDVFGNLEKEVSEFSDSWAKENALAQKLEALINSEAQRLRDIEVCCMELEELNEASVKEGEDEILFAEYSLLVNSEDLVQKTNSLLQTLTGEKQSVISALNRQKAAFEGIIKIDPTLSEAEKSYQNVILELQEVAYTLTAYQSRIEYNPAKIQELNDRLTLINNLKRKYGPTILDVQQYKKKIEDKLENLENADAQIEDLKTELSTLKTTNNDLSTRLSEKRQQAAKTLEKALVKQLRSLNMPKVEFHVEIHNQKRSRTGDDLVEFFLQPNIGEHKIPLKESASGGELSRVLLALQTVLSGKEKTPTLIFDEIDANIGGETAVVVGEKLKEIGRKHQVLCITHFPQVAKQADHHIQIAKTEKGGRTVTQIQLLSDLKRQQELERMQGGKLAEV